MSVQTADINNSNNYFRFLDIIEVHHDELWGKKYANCSENFNVEPTSALRPFSVTEILPFRTIKCSNPPLKLLPNGLETSLTLNFSVALTYCLPQIS